MKGRVSSSLYVMMKLYGGDVLRICCMSLVVINVFLLFAAPARGTAIMNVLSDSYYIHSYTIWSDNLESLPPTGTYPGDVSGSLTSGSLFSPVPSTNLIWGNGGVTNMGWADARIDKIVDPDRLYVSTTVIVDDDVPYRPYLDNHPHYENGYGYAHSEWNVLFDIHGDKAILDANQGYPGNDIRDLYFINKITLLDLSIGSYISLGSEMELLDGHRYRLSMVSEQRVFGADESSFAAIELQNVAVTIPESGSIFLWFTGLIGVVGIRRKRKNKE